MALAVGRKFARERPLPFHNLYLHNDGRSYPTSRDSPKPQPACGVCHPQLLLMEMAVPDPNHSPSPKTSTTNPRQNYQNMRQNQIAARRTGVGTTRRKAGKSGTGYAKISLCSKRLPANGHFLCRGACCDQTCFQCSNRQLQSG